MVWEQEKDHGRGQEDPYVGLGAGSVSADINVGG